MKILSSKRLLGAIIALSLLGACSDNNTVSSNPIDFDEETACSLDGMILNDYPGPKAQIVYAMGEPDYFCDTIELIAIYLNPEQQRKISGIYVQNMAKADWMHPVGEWIDAKAAFYVVGSKVNGAMGPTFASFATEEAANTFAAKEGGKVYRFDELKPDMAILDGGVIKDTIM